MVNNLVDKAHFIHDYTGFDIQDCLAVLEAGELYDTNKIVSGESVKYGKLFILEPYLVKGRNRYDINTGKNVYTKKHHGLRVRALIRAQEALKELDKKK